ncbi:MAG: hypothetical protein WC557_12260 [Ignavibacteriaceae bacterium]
MLKTDCRNSTEIKSRPDSYRDGMVGGYTALRFKNSVTRQGNS